MEKGCPYCANKKVLEGYNDFASEHPELLDEWDYDKNDILPTEITSGSNKKVHWKCSYGHEWVTSISGRSHGAGCPKCNCRQTSFFEYFVYIACCEVFGEENVLHRDKELFGFELDIAVPKYKIAFEPGSWFWHKTERKKEIDHDKAKTLRQQGWDCFTIFDSFDGEPAPNGIVPFGWHYIRNCITAQGNLSQLSELLEYILSQYVSIPKIDWKMIEQEANIRAKRRCDITNSLAHKSPEKLADWDYDKNQISPEEIYPRSNILIWWTCPDGHSYQMTPENKKANRCPVCEERIIIKEINHISDIIDNFDMIWDFETNNGQNLLANNIGKEKRNHHKDAYWICPHCQRTFKRGISTLLHGKRPTHNNCPHCGGQSQSSKKNKKARNSLFYFAFSSLPHTHLLQ